MQKDYDELSFRTNKHPLRNKCPPQDVMQEKEKPCFEASGILAEYQNKYGGTVLKFTEPLDASLPESIWKIFIFKDDQALDPKNLNKKTWYLFGRDAKVADIVLQNPSCSSQHAVIQFRQLEIIRDLSAQEQQARGLMMGSIREIVVKPYLMDLESTNKTFLNGIEIEPARYYELRDKDILKFGESQREYVIMNEKEYS